MSGLAVTRCTACGRLHVVEPAYCDCDGDTFEVVDVRPTGEIASYTRLHVVPPEFEASAPYTVAIVELDAGIHVAARNDTDQEVTTGAPVVVERRREAGHWITELEGS